MNKTIIRRTITFLLAGVFLTGCTTTTDPAKSSTRAKPLQLSDAALPDLKRFDIAVVKPFDTSNAKNTDPSVGVKLAEDIARRLKHDFGPLFTKIEVGNPGGATNELVITGEITKYAPGDKAMRGLLIGLGAASFNGNLQLKDGDQRLVQIPFDKLWAWGGALGMSRGIEDMEAETAASAANTIARQKGWTPPAKK